MRFFVLLVSCLLLASPTEADWVILADGQRIEVRAVEITDRAVHMTTLAGKRWSIQRSAVDVEKTLASNESEAPPAVVVIAPDEPVRPPAFPPAPPPPPPPPPPALKSRPSPTPPPPPPVVEPAPEPPTAPATERSHQHRFSISLNGAVGTQSLAFSDVNRFELFKEQAQIESLYQSPRAQGVEVGAQYRIAGPIALGGAVQLFRSDREASYVALLPHPFYFDRFRELSGTETGLAHDETAVHLDAFVTKTWGALTLDIFGGPSWFSTRTEVLVDVRYEETFPFNSVAFEATQVQVLENRPFGYNFGTSATFRLAGIFGIDFEIRYSDARARLQVEENREIELDVGGLRLGAGLRLLFP